MTDLKRLYLWSTVFPSVIVLLSIVLIPLFSRFLPAKLPLFYSLPWGEKQLASQFQFLVLPAILAVITLLNLIIASHLHEQQSFFKKIILTSTILSTIILAVTLFKIILIFA